MEKAVLHFVILGQIAAQIISSHALSLNYSLVNGKVEQSSNFHIFHVAFISKFHLEFHLFVSNHKGRC